MDLLVAVSKCPRVVFKQEMSERTSGAFRAVFVSTLEPAQEENGER